MRTLLVALCSLAVASAVEAQGWVEPLPGRIGVVKERTTVTVHVRGRIARVEVEEWFRNPGGGLAEGDYIYPLPGEAVFGNFSLFQGDQELTGETMDAARARAIYEEIVRRKRDPALIELAGHGMIRARVFPIGPGERRKITLRYTQVLERAGDALQFRYASGARIAHVPVHPEGAAIQFVLEADSAARFRDPFSPTHEVDVARSGGQLTVRPRGELRGDFVVFLPLARGTVGLTLATHRPAGEDGYFMLTLSPGEVRGSMQPRDVSVVVDVSGSMSGTKLEQAKAALVQLLGSLRAQDRFRLLSFSNGVSVYREDWVRATPAALRSAREWVEALHADGGTNIAGALAEAFRVPSAAERLPIVVFLTDGLPSVGERDPERIAAQAEASRERARVFAFGVGHDVNTYLLDRLSAACRGTTEYVEPGESVEAALGALATKIQNPVLVDLAIADAPVALTEIYPTTLPDLFAGEELVLFGRYRAQRDDRPGAITISGRRAGRLERFATDAVFPTHQNANDYLPRLWASRKIGELTRRLRLEGPSADLVREIKETALRYGILTEFTSYLVQEPDMIAANRQNLPADVVALSAPSAAVGAGAVAVSEQARARRETKSLSDLTSADEALFARADGPQASHVSGRLFVLKNGMWTDLAHGDSLTVTSVEPFSDAYFAVLRALPELEPYVARFDSVLVAGRHASIRVAAGGVTRLSDAQVDGLVRAFRGR